MNGIIQTQGKPEIGCLLSMAFPYSLELTAYNPVALVRVQGCDMCNMPVWSNQQCVNHQFLIFQCDCRPIIHRDEWPLVLCCVEAWICCLYMDMRCVKQLYRDSHHYGKILKGDFVTLVYFKLLVHLYNCVMIPAAYNLGCPPLQHFYPPDLTNLTRVQTLCDWSPVWASLAAAKLWPWCYGPKPSWNFLSQKPNILFTS